MEESEPVRDHLQGAGTVSRRPGPVATRIEQLFAPENFREPHMIEWVCMEAEYVVKMLEADPTVTLAGRMKQGMPPENLLRYFRRRERIEKARCIIQYLLAFLKHIPSAEEVRADLIDPAEQFRSFIAYESDLLLEADVQNAVSQGPAGPGEEPRGGDGCGQRMLLMNRMLRSMLARREENPAVAIACLCRALEQLAHFWFDVHGHDISRVRRCDIFKFLLAHLVRERCGG